jgi:hypothetical protein
VIAGRAAVFALATLVGIGVPTRVHAAPSTGAWTQLDNPLHPSARAYVASAYDPDIDATVIFGGSSYGHAGLLNETWLHHHDGTWTQLTGAQPGARQLSLMAYDPAAHQVILFGGAGPALPGDPTLQRLADTWAFDGTVWTQLQPATSPPARFLAAMTYSSALHAIVLYGGNDPNGPDNDTWTWSGGNWHHVVTTAAPSPRESPQLSEDPLTGNPVLYGGAHVSPFNPFNDTWAFDGTNWTQLNPVHNPGARAEGVLTLDPIRHRTLLFGGWDNNVLRHDVYLWDGVDWSATSPATSPFNRSVASSAFDAGSNEVLVLFGDNSGNAQFEDVWGWDGAAWHDRSAPLEPYQRFEGMMSFDPVSGHTIVFGGIGPDGNDLGDTWSFDGSGWTLVAGSGPPPRRDAAFAFTPQGEGILFGGFHNGTQLNDTWSWTTASGWHAVGQTAPPAARQGPAMAWDPSVGALILFGGEGSVGLGDTWKWSSGMWTLLPTAVVPMGRAYPAIAYDPISAQLLMFGGYGSGTFFADTWAFDGTLWTQLTPAHSPAGRWAAAIGTSLGHVHLFGGTVDTGANGDTWTWTGADWQQQILDVSPSARQSPLSASDTRHDQFLVFGGAGQIRYQETWAFGAAPAAQIPETTAPFLLLSVAAIVAGTARVIRARRAKR